MISLFVALQGSSLGDSIGLWPVTIAGWFALVAAVFSVGAVILGWGKLLEKLNGYGGRLTEVEKFQTESRTHRQDLQRNVDRVLSQHETILERLGEAKRTSEKCTEETQDMAINIGSKIDEMRRELHVMNLSMSQRIKAVETVLKLKGD